MEDLKCHAKKSGFFKPHSEYALRAIMGPIGGLRGHSLACGPEKRETSNDMRGN